MNKITSILALIGPLITAIKAIEEVIPGSGQGEHKLAALRQIIESVDDISAKFWPQIQIVVGILVSLFNATGVFIKKS